MACHSALCPLIFPISPINGGPCLSLFFLPLSLLPPRRRAAIHPRENVPFSVYTDVKILALAARYSTLPCPLYIDSSIHFISLFLTAIFPTTNHPATFASQASPAPALFPPPFFFFFLLYSFPFPFLSALSSFFLFSFHATASRAVSAREIGERNAGRAAALHYNQYDAIAPSTGIGAPPVHKTAGIYSRLCSMRISLSRG